MYCWRSQESISVYLPDPDRHGPTSNPRRARLYCLGISDARPGNKEGGSARVADDDGGARPDGGGGGGEGDGGGSSISRQAEGSDRTPIPQDLEAHRSSPTPTASAPHRGLPYSGGVASTSPTPTASASSDPLPGNEEGGGAGGPDGDVNGGGGGGGNAHNHGRVPLPEGRGLALLLASQGRGAFVIDRSGHYLAIKGEERHPCRGVHLPDPDRLRPITNGRRERNICAGSSPDYFNRFKVMPAQKHWICVKNYFSQKCSSVFGKQKVEPVVKDETPKVAKPAAVVESH